MTDPSATPVLPAAVVHGCAAGAEVPDVLLIHSAGGDRRHFPPALTDLPGVRVHALDLPGHGAAGGGFADRVEVYADAIAAYVEARGLARVVLAGHSMGGAVVMTLAVVMPEVRTPMFLDTLELDIVARGADAERLIRAELERWGVADVPGVAARGTPEDIAGPVLFLASAAAAFVTGVVLPVDGGYLVA